MGDDGRYPVCGLVAADPSWPSRYAVHAAELGSTLGGGWALEHVGSTSVPGLVAKPVIDIAIRVPPGAILDDASSLLALAGWSEPVAVGDHWATFRLEDGVRVAIGHLFAADRWAEATCVSSHDGCARTPLIASGMPSSRPPSSQPVSGARPTRLPRLASCATSSTGRGPRKGCHRPVGLSSSG